MLEKIKVTVNLLIFTQMFQKYMGDVYITKFMIVLKVDF